MTSIDVAHPVDVAPSLGRPSVPVRRWTDVTWRSPAVFGGRRMLQLALGVLWLLDGALQLQPFMFSKGFATRIIAPTASGQPAFVRDPVHWASALVLGHPLLWDLLFASVQLAIGAAFLVRRLVRPAIAVSIAWALGVWLMGEGLGGLAGGGASFVAGAPGAVILYVVIGLAAWPPLGAESRAGMRDPAGTAGQRIGHVLTVADDGPPARWLPGVWAALWGLFALLQALPPNDGASQLASQVAATASTAPRWLAQAQHAVGGALASGGAWSPAGIIVLYVAIGALGLLPGRARRSAAVAGIAVALFVWVVGQAFGQIPTGMGTDPNSGLLVAVLGVALLGRTRAPAPADRGLRYR